MQVVKNKKCDRCGGSLVVDDSDRRTGVEIVCLSCGQSYSNLHKLAVEELVRQREGTRRVRGNGAGR